MVIAESIQLFGLTFYQTSDFALVQRTIRAHHSREHKNGQGEKEPAACGNDVVVESAVDDTLQILGGQMPDDAQRDRKNDESRNVAGTNQTKGNGLTRAD